MFQEAEEFFLALAQKNRSENPCYKDRKNPKERFKYNLPQINYESFYQYFLSTLFYTMQLTQGILTHYELIKQVSM